MFNPKDIIDILAENVKKTKNPFGVNKQKINSWYVNEDLPDKGEYLLFTGLMYQMIPYIEAVTSQLGKIEDSKFSKYSSLGRFVPRSLTNISLNALISKNNVDFSNEVLKSIITLLKNSNIDFLYSPDLDQYSGILLYDLGDEKYFKAHARTVANTLYQHNISKIITVDPHTTYALKVLYPKYIGINFEVYTYFELLNLTGDLEKEVVLHDPCFYGRYLELSHVPRNLLKNMGVEIKDILRNGKFTHCCGGPAESLSPKLASKIRENRVKQLKETNKLILTMCPICYTNLRKSTSNIMDLAIFLKDCVTT